MDVIQNSVVIEIVGWLGTALILLAYFLLTIKKINRDSKSYHGMNLIGGLGIVVNSILNGAYPPAGLNLVWSVIALYGIIKGLRIFKRSSK